MAYQLCEIIGINNWGEFYKWINVLYYFVNGNGYLHLDKRFEILILIIIELFEYNVHKMNFAKNL